MTLIWIKNLEFFARFQMTRCVVISVSGKKKQMEMNEFDLNYQIMEMGKDGGETTVAFSVIIADF